MAAYPAPLGIPGLVHFWDPSTTAHALIARLYERGDNCTYEDVVWHAWGQICDLYFPKIAMVPHGTRWSVDRDAYRGLPPQNPSYAKPDLIVIKLEPLQTAPNQVPQFSSRDYLWIECKPASHNSPSGWKNALNEAIARLNHAHRDRTVFLIIAVGWKCILLIWDPQGLIQDQRQLWIRSTQTDYQSWPINPHIKAVFVNGGVNLVTGEIMIQDALPLDCWTTMEDRPILQNRNALSLIERFLSNVQCIALQGPNLPTF